jgi:hypothetical protein
MSAIDDYKQWFGSQPDWIQTALSLDGRKKDDYISHLYRNGQFRDTADSPLGWIQGVLSLNGREKDDYLWDLHYRGQFRDMPEIQLRDAEIRHLKFLENPVIRRYLARKKKPRRPRQPKVDSPQLSALERALDQALKRSFKELQFACEWGLPTMDAKNHPGLCTIDQIAAQFECDPKELKKRLVRQGYTKNRLTRQSFYHLQDLEKDERNRAAQKRQAAYRANESEESRSKRQFADRQSKQQVRAGQKRQKTSKKVIATSAKKSVTDTFVSH